MSAREQAIDPQKRYFINVSLKFVQIRLKINNQYNIPSKRATLRLKRFIVERLIQAKSWTHVFHKSHHSIWTTTVYVVKVQ